MIMVGAFALAAAITAIGFYLDRKDLNRRSATHQQGGHQP